MSDPPPQCLVWLPLMHRLANVENGKAALGVVRGVPGGVRGGVEFVPTSWKWRPSAGRHVDERVAVASVTCSALMRRLLIGAGS